MNVINHGLKWVLRKDLHGNLRYLFSRNGENNEKDEEKNVNYENSRKVIVMKKKAADDNKISKFQELAYDDQYHFRMLMLGNCLLAFGIPLYKALNVGMVIWNGGFILNRMGHQIKKYLLLLNNNQLQKSDRQGKVPFYFKSIINNGVILCMQSIFLASGFYQFNSIISIIWILSNIYKKVLPSHYAYILIPLLVSLGINIFYAPLQSLLSTFIPALK